MIKVGDKVKYVGPDYVAYENGKLYEVTGYNKKHDAYKVMSELGEDYYLSKEDLQEVPQKG